MLLAVELGVLLVTGVHLWYEYRPTASEGWDDLYGLSSSVSLAQSSRTIHRWVAHGAVLTALATAALGVAAVIEERRRRLRLVPAAVLALAVLAASITGYLLPWDQLALWAVTVGTNMSGVGDAIDGDKVRFVLIEGSEISVTTYSRWAWIHVAALPVVIAAVGAAAWRALRRRPAGIAPEEGE